MTSKERFDKLLHFSPDLDRAPVVEWATWWTLTIDRWKQEGTNSGNPPETKAAP